MQFDLTPEENMIRGAVRDFAEGVVAPGASERDETGVVPFDIMQQMGALGFFGIPFSEDWGG
ncbi:MAG: acyl-CoA dehydrogenase, partial [Sulfobacillus benefaciens]